MKTLDIPIVRDLVLASGGQGGQPLVGPNFAMTARGILNVF